MTESKTQSVAILASSEVQPGVDAAVSENRIIPNARSPTGILDLPTEIRLMIFRHLLVSSRPRNHAVGFPGGQSSLSILETNRLIHREAFDVLWRENSFDYCLYFRPIQVPRILETIQNIEEHLTLGWGFNTMYDLVKLMRLFGNSTGVRRGTLSVTFHLSHHTIHHLQPFLRVLTRFDNFRTIELHFFRFGALNSVFDIIEYAEQALEPIFGRSKYSSREKKGLLFHPIDHRNRLMALNHGNGADSLDGIRLEWNTDDAEIPVQNREMKIWGLTRLLIGYHVGFLPYFSPVFRHSWGVSKPSTLDQHSKIDPIIISSLRNTVFHFLVLVGELNSFLS